MLHHASQTNAAIIHKASAIPHFPENGLIGRDEELTTIQQYLNTKHRILITGDGGIGKSSLAASVAATHFLDEDDAVLWLWFADSGIDELFEALVRPFGQQQLVAGLSEAARILFVQHLLGQSTVRCVVFDGLSGSGIWNLGAEDRAVGAGQLFQAIPIQIPLIITTRSSRHYDMFYPDIPSVRILPLHLDDSKRLFHRCTPSTLSDDTESDIEEICQLLAGNPYLVCLVAKTVATTHYSLDQVLDTLSAATTPLVNSVVEMVLSALDAQSGQVLSAFAGFMTPDVNAELLALYMVERPSITVTQLKAARSELVISNQFSDEELREFLIGRTIQSIDLNLTGVQAALATLEACGLVEKLLPADEYVPVFRIPSLIHDMLRSMFGDDILVQGADACLMFLRRHNEPQLAHFAAIEPLLNTLHHAAHWSFNTQRYADAERFAWDLYANSQLLDFRGYYAIAGQILRMAVLVAEKLGNPRNQATHLRHLGMCYCDTGRKSLAADAFRRAADLFHAMSDIKSEVTALAALGDTYRSLGHFDQAVETYQHVLQISRELNDAWGQSKALANLGRSYRRKGQYDDAIHYIAESLAICRGMVDLGGEANMLRYLGNIYREMGNTQGAVEHYMAALTLVRDIGDRKMEANILGNIGEVYNRLGHTVRADEYYHQAYQLYNDIEDTYGLIDMLTKIAQLAFVLKDYDKALHYFEGARELGSQKGDTRQTAISMWSIATVYDAAGDSERAESYFDDVQTLYEALELGDREKEKP